MKTTSLFSLLILALVLQSFSADAVIIRPVNKPEYPAVLIAEKNSRLRYYPKGEPVKVWFNSDEKIRGIITGVGADSVVISSFGNGTASKSIAISSITGITKLKRKERKMAGIAAAAVAVVVGILTITSKGAVFDSAWEFAIVGIPAIAAGYCLLLYVGATYLLQLLNKSSIKRGWKFYQENPKPVAKGFFRSFSK